jgi:hypothetical protein
MAKLKATEGWQDKKFIDNVLDFKVDEGCGSDFLERVVLPWINDEVFPDQAFERKILEDWAKEQDPGDIFDYNDLEKWAIDNGFVKED